MWLMSDLCTRLSPFAFGGTESFVHLPTCSTLTFTLMHFDPAEAGHSSRVVYNSDPSPKRNDPLLDQTLTRIRTNIN